MIDQKLGIFVQTTLEEAIVDRIANGKKFKTFIAVHLYGVPYNVEAVKVISDRYTIPVLE
jgi:dTDP-4-amino-4,6-dideoxygalactose transaminase